MDLDFTPEQELLRETVRGVCARHCGLDVRDHTVELHRVAREDRALHAERHAPESTFRSGPVGEVALEPRRLVGRVQEDVPGAVAVHGKVVVVVHGPPVPGGQGAEHDGRGGHVEGVLRYPKPV